MLKYINYFILIFVFISHNSFAANDTIDWNKIDRLDLKTAGKIALKGNPSIAAAMARVSQAKEHLAQARSMYWPRLDFNMSAARVSLSDNAYNKNLNSVRMFDPNASIDDPDEHYNAGFTATWILFNGFEREFTNAAARLGTKRSEAAMMDVKRLILSAVFDAYFAAQLARENIAIAKADEDFNLKLLKEAKALLRSGLGSRSDELNFDIRVNMAKSERINAEHNYETVMFGLASLLGAPNAKFPIGLKLAKLEAETSKEMILPNTDTLIDYALQHRSDIRQYDFALKQAETEIKIVRSRFYPDINLSGSLNGERSGSVSLDQDDFGNTIALNFSYNLFEGKAGMASLKEAKAKKLEAEKNLQDIKLKAFSEVRSSVNNLESAQKLLVLQRANAVLVKENRDLVEKEYKAGQTSLVHLNEAQRDLITAKSRQALALVSLRQAWFKLDTSTAKILADFD